MPTIYENFIHAVEHGDLDTVKRLLPSVDPMIEKSQALLFASRHGYLEIVKLLIPLSDPSAPESDVLFWPASNGHLSIVKLLIPFVDKKSQYNPGFVLAAKNGHLAILELLISSGLHNQGNTLSDALDLAAGSGQLDVVKLLIPLLPQNKETGSGALYRSAVNDHFSVIDVLYPISSLSKALGLVTNNFIKSEGLLYLERLFKAEQEKKFLKSHMPKDTTKPRPKKI